MVTALGLLDPLEADVAVPDPLEVVPEVEAPVVEEVLAAGALEAELTLALTVFL